MRFDCHTDDYEPVNRPGRPRAPADWVISDSWRNSAGSPAGDVNPGPTDSSRQSGPARAAEFIRKNGHSLSFAALFVFTIVLWVRPAELYPSELTRSIAFIIGVVTLAIYFPTQLLLEGNLTARPREVNMVLLFTLAALLSIPLGLDPAEGYEAFTGSLVKAVAVFVVMANVVRTEGRLKAMLLLALVVSSVLSLSALNEYRLGQLAVEGYRVSGAGQGMVGNPNDLALHLVTMVPIALCMGMSSRGPMGRAVYFGCAMLFMGAIIVTFSRGAFLGLIVAIGVIAWKLGRNNRLPVMAVGAVLLVLLLAVAPSKYLFRLASIFIPSLDPVESSTSRQALLTRSLAVAIRHPLLGVGLNNFHIVSIREQVTHNAYTQVAAEIGTPALLAYLVFLINPIRRLAAIDLRLFPARRDSRAFYLAVGLQASLIGYMVNSFFASVAFTWFIYYLVGYAVCLRRVAETGTGSADSEDRARCASTAANVKKGIAA